MWAPVSSHECAPHGRRRLSLLRDGLLARARWVAAVDCAGEQGGPDRGRKEVILSEGQSSAVTIDLQIGIDLGLVK